MRLSSKVVCAVAAAILVHGTAPAHAGDMPWLRGTTYEPGTPTVHRWSGFYAGGQVGFSGMQTDFSRATTSLVAFALRTLALENEQHPSQWVVLGKTDKGFANYGFFLGYNTQWEDVILGVEFNYNYGRVTHVAPEYPMTRAVGAGGNSYVVNLSGSAELAFKDYATFRGRAGYIVGDFMPYVVAGFALGRADIIRSMTISGTETAGTTITPFLFTDTDAKANTYMFGYVLGAGVEYAVMQNFFVRGEWEFVKFGPTKDIQAYMNTVRLGAGFKF